MGDIVITHKTPGGRGVDFLNDGVLEARGVTSIDIVGSGHKVVQTGTGEVIIYSPVIDLVSPFNSYTGNNDTTVDSIAITDRYISAPTVEGDPFKIGDWTPDTLHPSTQSDTWVYSTNNPCLFEDENSTIEVKVYDADGVSILSSKLTGAISGNYTHTSNNIRIQVTDWTAEYGKFKGVIIVTVYTGLILPQGGKLSVKIIHHNISDYIKIQEPVFYDPDPLEAILTGVNIIETAGSVVTKFLSGVEYYTTGSLFTTNISDMDNLNQLSYPEIQAQLFGSDYGLSSLDISGDSMTNWTSSFDKNDVSFDKTDWAIDVLNYYHKGDANISGRFIDWSYGDFVLSGAEKILVNTKTLSSTRIIERFEEESWRCPLSGNFDLPNQRTWDSSLHVGLNDAVFINGGCGRITEDFRIYKPNSISQPDYTGQNAISELVREVQHDGTASANMRIYISGTYTGLYYKLAKEWTGSASAGTVWIDALKPYNYGDWNNGNPQNNTGGYIYIGDGYIDVTFGSNNIINCNNTVYIKIEFADNEFINVLSILFS